jgi:hypothetical protein
VEGVDDEDAVARWQDKDVIVEKVVMSSSPPSERERNAESRVDMVVTKEESTYGGVDTVG